MRLRKYNLNDVIRKAKAIDFISIHYETTIYKRSCVRKIFTHTHFVSTFLVNMVVFFPLIEHPYLKEGCFTSNKY